jgi:hypothetical protein
MELIYGTLCDFAVVRETLADPNLAGVHEIGFQYIRASFCHAKGSEEK